MSRRIANITSAAFVLGALVASPVAAVTIAAQDFDANTRAVGVDTDNTIGTAPGTVFDGVGLGWTASITGGTQTSGDSGDLIGVVDADTTASIGTGSNDLADAAGLDGGFFLVDDSDGLVELAFDSVDTTGFENLLLGFTFAASDTGYESADIFDVAVNGTSFLNISGDALEDASFTDSFLQTSLDLSLFDGGVLDIVFSFATSAAGEDLGIDNFVLSGDAVTAVPLPAGLPLLLGGLAVFGLIGRRRRA